MGEMPTEDSDVCPCHNKRVTRVNDTGKLGTGGAEGCGCRGGFGQVP